MEEFCRFLEALPESDVDQPIRFAFVRGATRGNMAVQGQSALQERAFQLGRDCTMRGLIGLLFRPWSGLTPAERCLAFRLAEWMGRGLQDEALIPLLELVASCDGNVAWKACDEDEAWEPLGDLRIAGLHARAGEALILEAALHRLGLTPLRGETDPDDMPQIQAEELLGVTVDALRELVRQGHAEWRRFPGVWLPLLLRGDPTEELWFSCPTGRSRPDPTLFVGAWTLLATDCLDHARECDRPPCANVATVAALGLVGISPLRNPFRARRRLLLSTDLAGLRDPACLVDDELREIADRLGSGRLNPSIARTARRLAEALGAFTSDPTSHLGRRHAARQRDKVRSSLEPLLTQVLAEFAAQRKATEDLQAEVRASGNRIGMAADADPDDAVLGAAARRTVQELRNDPALAAALRRLEDGATGVGRLESALARDQAPEVTGEATLKARSRTRNPRSRNFGDESFLRDCGAMPAYPLLPCVLYFFGPRATVRYRDKQEAFLAWKSQDGSVKAIRLHHQVLQVIQLIGRLRKRQPSKDDLSVRDMVVQLGKDHFSLLKRAFRAIQRVTGDASRKIGEGRYQIKNLNIRFDPPADH